MKAITGMAFRVPNAAAPVQTPISQQIAQQEVLLIIPRVSVMQVFTVMVLGARSALSARKMPPRSMHVAAQGRPTPSSACAMPGFMATVKRARRAKHATLKIQLSTKSVLQAARRTLCDVSVRRDISETGIAARHALVLTLMRTSKRTVSKAAHQIQRYASATTVSTAPARPAPNAIAAPPMQPRRFHAPASASPAL
jgi:hypothetical protein